MLKSPSGKIYIGQTTCPIEERLKGHLLKSSHCRAIYNAIQFYGWENIEKDWYYCPDEDLNKHEELMVEVLGTLSPNGYNLREGGGARGKASEETKQKIRESRLGKTHREESKQKVGYKNRGKTHSKETREKLSEARRGEKNHMFGKSHTDESKQKNRDAHIGKKQSEETIQKKREATLGEKHPSSKRVYQYDLDGTFINSFGSGESVLVVLENIKPHMVLNGLIH